jgi:tetratricopeptide (TPR) repeat protein
VRRVLTGAAPLVPTAALTAAFCALAWREHGSVLAEDWLPYALGAGLLVATVVASGAGLRPPVASLVGLGCLIALAAWTALSASWSPVPALARDEALLVLLYACAVAVPLLTLRTEGEHIAGIAIVIVAGAGLAAATSLRLVAGEGITELYWAGRLASPVGYPGAQAAIFLVSFWPAAGLAATARLPIAVRALALSGAAVALAGLLMTQSRAGAAALAFSAIVVFAIAPARLRLLVPVACAAALAAVFYRRLTDPFDEAGTRFEDAIRDAGSAALAVAFVGVLLGLVYALADRKLTVPRPVARAAGAGALALLALGAVGGIGAYLVATDKPVAALEDRWHDFKRQPEVETGSTHFATLGTNRYDLWRVALNEFREHPLAGAGGRAIGTMYLGEARTDDTPKRAHSLELDVLSETGVIGLAFLVGALLPFVWIALRRAASDLIAAGLLGGIVYWLAHASVDWIWTFPAASLPFFLLLGAAAAGGERPRILSTAVVPAGLALAAAVGLLFAPPWLSSRYTARALEQTSAEAAPELRWARRLDPLSIHPLVAEAELAPIPERAIAPLQEAVEREPRSLGPRYLLGLAYLDVGRRAAARRELRKAFKIAPRSYFVREALRRAESARGES